MRERWQSAPSTRLKDIRSVAELSVSARGKAYTHANAHAPVQAHTTHIVSGVSSHAYTPSLSRHAPLKAQKAFLILQHSTSTLVYHLEVPD